MGWLFSVGTVCSSVAKGRAMDPSRYSKKIITFCSFADQLEKLSVCKRHSVGCTIFDAGCTQVLSVGYNGPAAGVDHDTCTGKVGNCGCIHAESNAMSKLDASRAFPALMYCTVFPCRNCASQIINSKVIIAVIFGEECRHEGVAEFFAFNGVNTYKFSNGIRDETLREWWSLSRKYR
jgi:deoxycytidylate deaminase